MSKLGHQAARGLLVATFGGSTALAYGLVRREDDVAVPASGDIALLGVATFKLSRLITKAKVTEFVREPFVEDAEPGADGEVNAEPVTGAGLRSAVGELLTCPFCVSVWLSTALVLLFARSPRAARLVASTLAVTALSDATQHANELLRSRTGGD
jgi:hypothetical protein